MSRVTQIIDIIKKHGNHVQTVSFNNFTDVEIVEVMNHFTMYPATNETYVLTQFNNSKDRNCSLRIDASGSNEFNVEFSFYVNNEDTEDYAFTEYKGEVICLEHLHFATIDSMRLGEGVHPRRYKKDGTGDWYTENRDYFDGINVEYFDGPIYFKPEELEDVLDYLEDNDLPDLVNTDQCFIYIDNVYNIANNIDEALQTVIGRDSKEPIVSLTDLEERLMDYLNYEGMPEIKLGERDLEIAYKTFHGKPYKYNVSQVHGGSPNSTEHFGTSFIFITKDGKFTSHFSCDKYSEEW